MTLNQPVMYLSFLGNDLQPGHSLNQTVNGSYIINNSIKIKRQLLNGLKSSSNQLTLQIAKDCSAVEDIVATDGDVKVVLKDGQAVIFTGYLSTNYTWTVASNGRQALNITIEDVGSRLLGKSFIENGHHFFNCTVHAAILAICDAAGVTVSPQCTIITNQIINTVDNGVTCKDLLEQILYENGYVFYFDNLGELRVYKIDCTSTSGVPVIDKTKLYEMSGRAISLTKKVRQYKSARVSFKSLGTASNFLVYRLTTGQDEEHPDCYMELGDLQWFDGLEIYENADWSQQIADEFRIPALIEACNAGSEQEKVAGNKIVAVSNVRKVFSGESGVTCDLIGAGGPYLQITAHNTGYGVKHITKLEAIADIIYEKDTTVLRTNESALETETSNNLIDEEMSFIHDKAIAQKHANLLAQYHKYCNSQYTFFSKEQIALGSVVELKDNLHSGLDTFVLVFASEESDTTDVFQYTAIGISVFSLDDDCYNQRIGDKQAQPARGADGKDASVIIQYAIGDAEDYPEDMNYGYDDGQNFGYAEGMEYGTSPWKEDPPDPEDIPEGMHLWMRISTDRGETWKYVRMSGERGERITSIVPYYALSTSNTTCTSTNWVENVDGWHKGLYVWQKDLEIYEDQYAAFGEPRYNKPLTDQLLANVRLQVALTVSKAYEINKRLSQPAKVYLSIAVAGYTSNTPVSSWFTITGGQVLYDSQKQSWYVVPSDSHFTLTLTEPTTGDYSVLEAEGIDVTEYSKYNGTISSQVELNALNAEVKVVGDYFLCSNSFSTYKAGEPYVWNGTQWTALTLGPTGQNENEYANIMAHCIDDALQCSAETNTKFFSFFQNFGANAAFIRNLMVYYLSIGSGTPSSGFYMRIMDGNPPTIIATYNGNEIWKIDATTGKMYGNFARVLQYLPFNFDDSLDASCPFECDFYIPASAEIKSIKLSARGQKFRAYSKSAEILGSSESEKQADPWSWNAPKITIPALNQYGSAPDTGDTSINIPSEGKTESATWGQDGEHSHELEHNGWNYSTDSSQSHSHGIPSSYIPTGIRTGGGHSHKVTVTKTQGESHHHSLPNNIGQAGEYQIENTSHTHMVDISHKHNLEFGIYEGTSPAGVMLYINNGSGYGSGINLGSSEALATNMDISQYLSGTGWKKLKFTSTRLGRITVQLIAELLVNT